MPTNRVTKGDSLRTLVLQPGWTIENDGFGLLTCSATYVMSHGNDAGTRAGDGATVLSAAPVRGAAFSKDERLSCHRSSSAVNSNGLLVVTAEYIGIAEGNMTKPQVSGRGATTTEPISTFPTFTTKIGGTKAAPLNGAVFNDDGSFKTFGDSEKKKYGVRSYYAPTFAFTGFFYTKDMKTVKTLFESSCTSSCDGQWKNIQLIQGLNALGGDGKTTQGAWSAPDEAPQLLLNGLSVEYFGTLMKVSYDVRFSADGFDTDIYPYAATGRPKRTNRK